MTGPTAPTLAAGTGPTAPTLAAGDFRRSSTTIARAQLCLRKWRWEELFPQPPSPWQAFGTAVHAQLETYLRGNGAQLDLTTEAGQCALAGVHLLPTPGPELWVEKSWSLQLGGHQVTGTMDLAFPPRRLYDHKTTKDFKWALTGPELLTNPQTVLYTWAMMQLTGAQVVDVQWTYFRRVKPYQTRPVNASLTAEHVASQLPSIISTLDTMAASSAADPLTLPANPDACSAYGGCPFQDRCQLTLADRIAHHEKQRAGVAPERQHLPMTQPTPQDFARAMAQGAINPPTAATAPAAPAPVTPYDAQQFHSPDRKQWFDRAANGGKGAWFPVPEALPPPPPPPQVVLPAVPPPVPMAPPPVVLPAVPPPVDGPVAAAAPKRGRRTKAEMRGAMAQALRAQAQALTALADLADQDGGE